MDCLPLEKHMIFVLVILCALHLAECVPPFRQFPASGRFLPVATGFTSAPVYQQFLPFRRQQFNSWFNGPFYFTRPPVNHINNVGIGSHFQNNFRSRAQNVQAQPSAIQSRWRPFRTYNSQSERPQFVPLITRPPNKPPTKVSVVNGPLSKVVPHPKPRNMKAKKRLRYRLVAKAKSFPGILKDTSMDVTKV